MVGVIAQAALVFVAGLVAAPAPVQAQVSPRIVNGLNTHAYPSAGALLYSQGGAINTNNAGSWCSGTLIGCQTFLTAAHCVEDDGNPANYWVYFQHAGIFAVDTIEPHPSYLSSTFPIADVAVVKLSSPVTGISPKPLNLSDNPANVGFGLTGTIVGFGQTSGSGGDYGIKRAGSVETADCPGSVPSGATNTELVCWRFTNPVGPPGDDSNTCNGDSGGPLFLDIGAGDSVAGITSGGTNGSCLATDNSYDANVYTYRSFILGELGADSTTVCGGLAPVGSPDVGVIGEDGTLSASNPSDSYAIQLAANVNAVRFALNGEDNGSLGVDMYVKQGAGASPSDFDCKEDGNTGFGACSFVLPAGGTWSTYIDRTAGSGEYQLTTTIFGGDPPVCGNDVHEPGEECDGTDAAACPGLCLPGCSCPAPVCGNDVIETGEECDGTDPGTCPTGVCDPDCTCEDAVCGNDIVEAGEECDGIDDAACPGECESECQCMSCFMSDIDEFTIRAKSNEKRFRYKSDLINTTGHWDGVDPRNQFHFVMSQAGASVELDVPPGDPGWFRSKPEKGRYKWKGDIGGFRRVRAIDRTEKRGTWRIVVKGKQVPGAEQIDVFFQFDIELRMDGVCASTTY